MEMDSDEFLDATIAWEGDSKDSISRFPDEAKQNLGFQLRLLQQGLRPTDYRSMSSVGPGVFELRDQDERAWYRVLYLSRFHDVIHVLHCFEKKSRQTPKKELEIARNRLKLVRARMVEEKRHGHRTQ
jgi:phage-related protein